MALQTTWFIFITLLWTGFFILEGFDFGVGMLVPVLGHDDTERRILRTTTGPFWDGNEVWLLTAGGATFAAFPDWYASMFQAYYLPLFVVLAALILRAVGTEFRDKMPTPRWRSVWDWAMAVACLLVPLLTGVALGGLLHGLPLDANHDFTGNFLDLVQPFPLFMGITFAGLCLLQGLMFLRLKTVDDLKERSLRGAQRVGMVVVGLVAVYMVWTQQAAAAGIIPNAGLWLALTASVAAAWLAYHPPHSGWAFTASATAIAFTVIGFFATLYPNLMVSSTSSANTITKADSSGSYTLTLMTVITLVMLPVVLLYTAWNYWVFRQRVTRADVAPASTTPS